MSGRDLLLGRKGSKYQIRLGDGGYFVGELANAAQGNLAKRLQAFPETRRFCGLEVAGIYRRYAEQDKKSFKDGNKTFYEDLTPEVKERGYYHVVEICGFVQPAP